MISTDIRTELLTVIDQVAELDRRSSEIRVLGSEIKAELLTIIDRMADLDNRRNEVKEQEQQVRERINVIRAKNLVEIAFARDNKEKSLYPSEGVREAALTVALDRDAEYQSLRERLRTLDRDLQEILVERERLSNRKTLLMFEAGISWQPSVEGLAVGE